MHGKSALVDSVITALLAGGHVLLEDVPGTGKTTLAQAVAAAMGCSFARVQFTADLLPSDLLGISVYDAQGSSFRFHPGPIFHHVMLADEINRTPPKTQSALLEAMNEGQVSIDGTLHPLPIPFLVLATQNPLDHHGTFPLPESQIDRFMMRLEVGYPDRDSERSLLIGAGSPRRAAESVLDAERVRALQTAAMRVTLQEDVADYALEIVRQTRDHREVALGVSVRGAQALARAARAHAFLQGRDHVVPDDVRAVAPPVLEHRILPHKTGESRDALRAATRILAGILASVPAPR